MAEEDNLAPDIVLDLARLLPTLRQQGDFYASGKLDMLAPSLEVDGVGRIALPLLPIQGEQLVAVAERAPFGRGEDTLIDTQVRRTWQIAADRVHLGGRHWQQTLDAVVAKAAAGLGVVEPIRAELYKLLVYDAGSFFVPHRDTEKAPGMFATLVVVLPSDYSCGELLIRHQAQAVSLDLQGTEPSELAYAAFYADCVHEMRPVTQGYRLTLVYNLIRIGNADVTAPPHYAKELATISCWLRDWVAGKDIPDNDLPEKLVYPLEHAYTPAELAFNTLKNADAAAAKVLVAAAEQSGCEIYLALVHIEEYGIAEYCDYGRHGEDFEADEVTERTETISEWRSPDGSHPALSALPLSEDEICSLDVLEDEEPDEEHFHEATGNEGASFERTYRRAALVLWPKSRKLAVLAQAGLAAGNIAALQEAALLLEPALAVTAIEQIVIGGAATQLEGCANLLHRMAMAMPAVATGFNKAAAVLLDVLIKQREALAAVHMHWQRPQTVAIVVDLLALMSLLGEGDLGNSLVKHALSFPAAYPVDSVLLPAVLQLTENPRVRDFPAVRLLRDTCLQHLHDRIALPLLPPADFVRDSKLVCQCQHCVVLSHFLASPERRVWDFQANERLRRHVENTIRQAACDVDFVTEKYSRPHSLVCTKNQASFERRVKQRQRDLSAVERLAGVSPR